MKKTLMLAAALLVTPLVAQTTVHAAEGGSAIPEMMQNMKPQVLQTLVRKLARKCGPRSCLLRKRVK